MLLTLMSIFAGSVQCAFHLNTQREKGSQFMLITKLYWPNNQVWFFFCQKKKAQQEKDNFIAVSQT